MWTFKTVQIVNENLTHGRDRPTASSKQLNWTDWFDFWWRLCVFDFMTLVCEWDRTIGEAHRGRGWQKGYCYSIHERVWIWWECNGWCWFERIGSFKKI